MNWYIMASKSSKDELTPREQALASRLFGDDLECTIAKDEDGYYCYTHRARSKSYESMRDIPRSVIDRIGSTG